ncbi:MAG: hypothetical protein ABR543_09480 [Gemmatimonadaceae bacterium]
MRLHSGLSPVLALYGRRIATFSALASALVTFGCGEPTATSPQLPQAPQPDLATTATYPMTLSVLDPVGDQTGPIDVVSMVMNFDNTTGQYEIIITADTSHPFVGLYRVNINLYNPDVTTYPVSSFFSDAMNDSTITTPTTSIILTGTNSVLLAWNSGHRVFTNSLAGTGNAPGISLFRSSVNGFPLGFLTNEDVIAFANLAQPATIQSATPAPIAVAIDIRPNRFPNVIEVDGRTKIAVAILSDATFDATKVDPLSVRFGPNGAREVHNRGHVDDVDRDGDLDMVLHFATQATGIALGDTQACLTGQTTAGVPFKGCDSILTKLDRSS